MHQLLHDLAVDVLTDLAETSQMEKVAAGDTSDISQNVSSASMNTLRSCTTVDGLMMSLPMDRLRSTPASCCKQRLVTLFEFIGTI